MPVRYESTPYDDYITVTLQNGQQVDIADRSGVVLVTLANGKSVEISTSSGQVVIRDDEVDSQVVIQA